MLLPVQNHPLWPRERRRPSLIGIHTSILSRSFLRQLVDLAHMLGNSLIICCEMLMTHQLLSETLGPPSRVFSTVPSPNNNSWQPLSDSWDLLSHPAAIYIWHSCLLVPATRDCTQPFSVSRPLQLCHVALLLTQLTVTYCFYACEYRPPSFAHSLFLSQARCSGAMWPCCDFTSSDDDEHNTDSSFLLLFADIGIMPTLRI